LHPQVVKRVSAKRESQRRLVVNAVFFIFALSFAEGALRKWFLPSLAGPLTLLRDPFVIVLYAYCFANGLIRTRGVGQLWLGFAIFTSLLGLWQYIANGYGIVGWVLGVRTYWLYMPLAFVVAGTFRREDVMRLIVLNLLISIPYAFLVSAQYSAGPEAFVNQGVGGDEEAAVGLSKNIVRPFGLFTYTGPNVDFTTASLAIFLAFYVGNTKLRWRWLLTIVAGVAVGSMAVLTGSRGIYFFAAVIVASTVVGLAASGASMRKLTKLLGVFGFVALAGLLLVAVFPDMSEAMIKRFELAERSEGAIGGRLFEGLSAWIEPLFTAPIWGHGIGAGAAGVANFLGITALIYGESDLQRNVNELGLLAGLAMLMLRFGTSLWIVWIAYRLARRQEVIALPLAAYTFVSLSVGQITHSPISAFLPWLFLGLVLALHWDQRRRSTHDIA